MKMPVSTRGIKFATLILLLQIIFILVIAFFGRYPDNGVYPEIYNVNNTTTGSPNYAKYPNFMDVNGMVFVGFGFLMTFLKNYGYSSVGLNLLISAVFIQWAAIVRGFIYVDILGGEKFHMGLDDMVTYDFATATTLISFGAVLGKTSPVQLVVMGIIEIVLAQLNEYIGIKLLKAKDIGESLFIHMFGAYFGLAVARVLFSKDIEISSKEGSVYHSDLFAMIGTIFLWIFWPSFNGGFAEDQQQRDRAYLNTFLSLCSCTAITFAVSAIVDRDGRFNMVHVQNSTLAGGVVVGATANMPMQPYGAMIFGAAAGTISVLGYKFLSVGPFTCYLPNCPQPLMVKHMKIHDTCGVHNLHGMPGVLAAIGSAILASMSYSWSESDRSKIFPEIGPTLGRSAGQQGGYQFLAATITLGIAIGGGLFTGFILKLPIWNVPEDEHLFDDSENWEIPEEGVPLGNSSNHYKVSSTHLESRM